MKDYKLLQQTYTVNTYAHRGLVLTSGEGVFLKDETGTSYLDVMTNYGVSIFGHAHPTITKALQDQLSRLVTLHGSFTNDLRAEAASRLVKVCGNELSQVYFANSGAEAVEAALKFAVLATGKHHFIASHEGYHGKTLGALSATGEEKYQKAFRPLIWNFTHIPHNNPEALAAAISEDTAAFIVEPIQGEGGIHLPEIHYLNKVRDICTKKGVLLIIDEIQTGCGRTGRFLASQENSVQYDIVCLGKGLAGGIPIGTTLVSKEVAAAIPRGSHTATFGGNPLACAGIIATLDLLNENLLQHVVEMGNYFLAQLKTVQSPLIVEVRGKGLMIGVEVKENRDKVLQLLQREHVLAIPAADNVVRFLPPYIINKQQVDTVVKTLRKVITMV